VALRDNLRKKTKNKDNKDNKEELIVIDEYGLDEEKTQRNLRRSVRQAASANKYGQA